MPVIDLTRPYGPSTIVWPGSHRRNSPRWRTMPNMVLCRAVHLYEHTGTHLDAPAHFVDGAETVDQISAERLVRPLAIIDIEAASAKNSRLRPDDRRYRAQRGRPWGYSRWPAVLGSYRLGSPLSRCRATSPWTARAGCASPAWDARRRSRSSRSGGSPASA